MKPVLDTRRFQRCGSPALKTPKLRALAAKLVPRSCGVWRLKAIGAPLGNPSKQTGGHNLGVMELLQKIKKNQERENTSLGSVLGPEA
ncbi:hypothetical protein GDO81_006960 [Engystomops pustulosus]|uniref:Uncharacterized protein n=1 Tax=Engystomops pustulosus TaxID=76066 RepID=A0AAV7D0H0_ENGPU|nr:hypothetical protein GDO81_006960 [Engystomops pustulosus]